MAKLGKRMKAAKESFADKHEVTVEEAVKLKSGATNPGRETVASVSPKQLREIAEAKWKDLNANDVEAAMKIIAGSARSMGIEVK